MRPRQTHSVGSSLDKDGRVDPKRPLAVKKKRKRAPRLTMKRYNKTTRERGRFDAFQVKEEYKDKVSGRLVKKKKVIEPEAGIHSNQWALAIISQSSPVLSIPLDIRQRIFKLYLYLYTNWALDGQLTPRRSKQKFRDAQLKGSPPIIEAYQIISLVSRQIYVEVVGSGLFYHVSKFYFSSCYTMDNYLGRINPLHLQHSIRSVSLNPRCTDQGLPRHFFELLEQMEGLRELTVKARPPAADTVFSNTVHRSPLGKKTVLEKIKEGRSFEAMKGRLETFDWTWDQGWMTVEDDAPNSELVGELYRLLVGRRKMQDEDEVWARRRQLELSQ